MKLTLEKIKEELRELYSLKDENYIHVNDAADYAENLQNASVPAETLVMPTLTGDLENDLQIIYREGKPYGIRDKSGYLLFFTEIFKYDGQMNRYRKEIDNQKKLAEYLLDKLSKCSA